MERNIITTIKFAQQKIIVNCIEKISTNYVEIFSSISEKIAEQAKIQFIKTSITAINKIIEGKLQSVFVILANQKNVNLQITKIAQEIELLNHQVTQVDIDKVINLAKEANLDNSERMRILVQPIRYEVNQTTSKMYHRAPLGKTGQKLRLIAASSTINKGKFVEITRIVKKANVKISQIVTSAHVFPHETLSNSALKEGAIAIHIATSQTFLAVMSNAALIKFEEVPFGYQQLITNVATIFACSQAKAEDLLAMYGQHGIDESIIYIQNNNLEKKAYHVQTLRLIIERFMKRILIAAAAFIGKKVMLTDLSVVFSGTVNKLRNLEQYAKTFLENEYISTYSPLSFIAQTTRNIEAIGVFNFIERYDAINGKNFDTLVETNPDRIMTLHYRKKSIFANLLDWLGGKNVRI